MKKNYQRNASRVAMNEIEIPDVVSVAMGELTGAMREGLLALAVGAGLQVMQVLMDESVTVSCGPKGAHDPDRRALRHGTEAGSVTLGGRQVPLRRPRVRTADRAAEVAVPAYELFAPTELLGELALERMMAKLSTRRYAAGLEPVGAAVAASARATSRSAVSRRFVQMTERALDELMHADLSALDLVALMIDGVHFAEHLRAHVAAFEFFGGVPARLVPDNLRTGVTKPDLYDPKLNRAYAELAAHYGCLVDPARASKPKDKPRVERPMSYIRDSFWRGREWENLEEMQTAATRWCLDVAGRRQHRSLDGAQPYAVFQAVEAPSLRVLPVEAFELAAWSRPKVGTDCHVKVAGALYSVPWSLIGQTVDARASGHTIEIFADGTLHKTHRRVAHGRATDWADYPPEKVAFFMRTPVWCRRRAGELGPAVAEIITELLAVNALHRLRSAQGIIGLAERHGPDRLDAACRHAIVVGDPTYRTVKGILAAGTETTDTPTGSSATTTPAHLHGPARLFAINDEVAS